MELGEPIFAVEGYDVGELGCNESCDRLQSVSVVENRSKIYWMDERLKAVQDMFEQQFGAGNARIVSSDLGDRNMLVWVGKTNQTGRSEERRVGKECVSTCRSRGSPNN